MRSKRDVDAVKAMLERFYPGWSVDVVILRGTRSVDRALDELKHVLSPNKLNVVLLCREDLELAEALSQHLLL